MLLKFHGARSFIRSIKMSVDSYTYTLGKTTVNILSYISLRDMTMDLQVNHLPTQATPSPE